MRSRRALHFFVDILFNMGYNDLSKRAFTRKIGAAMATSKDYLNYILEQLSEIEGITHRQMMGEYIIYLNGRVAAYLCDNRLLIKPTPTAMEMMKGASPEPPYEGAKEMLLCENTEDREFLKALFEGIYEELPEPKKRKK